MICLTSEKMDDVFSGTVTSTNLNLYDLSVHHNPQNKE